MIIFEVKAGFGLCVCVCVCACVRACAVRACVHVVRPG